MINQSPVLDANGLPSQLNLDVSGNLKTSVTGAGSGGTSSVDEGGFTAGASAGTAAMGENGGELLILSCDASRNLNVNIQASETIPISGSFSSTPPTSSTASAVAQQTVGSSSGAILASNGSRKACAVQNTGTVPVYIGLGKVPTATAYHLALRAGGSSNDGTSERWDGTLSGVLWQGAVNAITASGGGTVVVTELT